MANKLQKEFRREKNDLPEPEDTSIISLTEKDSKFSYYIAISPDGQQIVTFNPEGSEFTLYDIKDSVKPISTFQYDDIVYDKRCCYSLAISNCIGNDKSERLVALSRFNAKEMLPYQNESPNHNSDENILVALSRFCAKKMKKMLYHRNESPKHDGGLMESGDEVNSQSRTWITSISTTTTSTNTEKGIEIYTSLGSIGGIIRFLDSDFKILGSQIYKPVIVIVNGSGIYKQTLNNDEIRSIAKVERFELPHQLSISLSRLDHGQKALELLHTCIIKNHFMVHSFKNRQQIIEMYNLITGHLEILFKRNEHSAAPNIIRGSPIFAISRNEVILAFCRGTISITLYLMENGLEITTKQLVGCGEGIYKILAIDFIDNDSKLLIVLEEQQESSSGGISIQQIFVVWDLFTTFKDSIRQINYPEAPLKMDATRQLINSHGKILGVTDNNNIISVLDNQDVASILNPPAKEMTKVKIKKDHVSHAIYDINGRFDASELTENQIIRNVEPWNSKKDFRRLSVWLDSTKRTQLIISHNTIQIWKYCNKNKIEKLDRVLKYIWASQNVGSVGLQVQELKIRKQEFMLNLLIPSTKSSTTKSVTIHWPSNANVLEGACRTLYVLREKKHIVAGHKNTKQFEYLIECTQKLVRKYITKYGIFRLTNIRYPIMKYLIKGHQESLIKYILNKKINGKNSNIHIPRLYKCVKDDDDDESVSGKDNDKSLELKLKSKTDLHYAILYAQRRADSTEIIKYLIDYYANNAKEYNNDGWMFTVSKAIPLLYDYGLSEFVLDLFKKLCFGTIEAYTPPLHINLFDQKKGNNAYDICSLKVKPCLAVPPSRIIKLWNIIRERIARIEPLHNDRKVYIVPLPDFTVYPNPKGLEDHRENYSKYFWFLRSLFLPRRKVINDTKQMSPFFRIIHEEKGHEIHQTPSIMAVLDFKWAVTCPYYFRHIIIYIFYAISYTMLVISYSKGESRTIRLLKTDSHILLAIFYCVYFYTGWYLIAIEIVQLKREGLYRYINIFNIFDCVSVVLPLICFFHQEFILQLFNPVLAFTALVMWFELLLLLRYFKTPGRFIYIITSILRTIWPFFVFMLITIFAFGHAMFILLDRADDSLVIPTYKIKDTSNPDIYSNITIYQDVDKTSRLDNYYSDLLSSIIAVFFWTNGRWDQLNQWDSFAVIAMSILGSIILVLIFQNMLIAFMNGAFDKSYKADHTEAYRYHTSNPDIYSNITIYQDVDKTSRLDNYYSDLLSSIIAVFFWTNGRWDQLNQWDSFAVIAMSILGSIILVLIFQNMLIAFMNGAFDKSYKADHTEAYRYRIDLIAEYESLEKFSDNERDNPRYIYYIPNPNVIGTWLDEKQKFHPMDKNLDELTDSDYSDDCDDDFDDDLDSDDSDHGDKNSLKIIIQNHDNSHIQNDVIFIDEEIFVTSSKSNKKSLQKKLNDIENKFKARFDRLKKNFKTLSKNQS
ncbi:hypothetical protein Glove_707g4 [Diversispora epigaea]|uniref:Ion transport domain-containing protein n=1 Tax=Diversispora epigaea TaxID=1348612 RepID=A0A397G4A5_9GLOM|nr:hypothetical protein Glove_707g4 [Diversispora epigaea]